jgi:hypothetical protein
LQKVFEKNWLCSDAIVYFELLAQFDSIYSAGSLGKDFNFLYWAGNEGIVDLNLLKSKPPIPGLEVVKG